MVFAFNNKIFAFVIDLKTIVVPQKSVSDLIRSSGGSKNIIRRRVIFKKSSGGSDFTAE